MTPSLHKLGAMVISGTISAAAGAAYGLLFGYAGASFASVQYSILPLLWVLAGRGGHGAGPFIGTLFMFYLIDLGSGITSAYMLIAGVALVALTLFAPQGLVGELRRRAGGGCHDASVHARACRSISPGCRRSGTWISTCPRASCAR